MQEIFFSLQIVLKIMVLQSLVQYFRQMYFCIVVWRSIFFLTISFVKGKDLNIFFLLMSTDRMVGDHSTHAGKKSYFHVKTEFMAAEPVFTSIWALELKMSLADDLGLRQKFPGLLFSWPWRFWRPKINDFLAVKVAFFFGLGWVLAVFWLFAWGPVCWPPLVSPGVRCAAWGLLGGAFFGLGVWAGPGGPLWPLPISQGGGWSMWSWW